MFLLLFLLFRKFKNQNDEGEISFAVLIQVSL